jgi:CheY-like chemotaxis protein
VSNSDKSKQLVLVVDSDLDMRPAVEAVCSSLGSLEVDEVDNPGEAKRHLVARMPSLMISAVEFGTDHDSGYRLCAEIRSHPRFEALPVLLLGKDQSFPQRVSFVPDQKTAFLGWPLPLSQLRDAVVSLVPSAAPVGRPVKVAAAKSDADSSDDAKIRKAQQLLALVLHNLKTSDLLRLSDIEDVPQVVFEITRSVCGIRESSRGQAVSPPVNPSVPAALPPGSSLSEDSAVSLDLDALFGPKKR